MRISSAFPSTYLKAADLGGRTVTVTIAKVILEQVNRGADQQPVVYFRDHTKGMVLNKTNARKIAEVYGDDTDNWIGGEIILYETMVEFQGESVAALRIRHVPKRQHSYEDHASFTPATTAPKANPQMEPPKGGQVASILVEAEAMTKQGIDAFRAWRDGLREDEYTLLQPHIGRLIGLANQPVKPPMLSEDAKKVLKKNKTEGVETT